MTNFDTARDALETSLDSSGSAMREHEKWQQSLEAQINKLKASWQSLSQTFLSSDFLRVAFDLVIKLVDGITLLIDKVGVLPTLLAGFSIFKSFGNKGLFKTINNELDGFINKIGIANKSFADLANAFNFGKTGQGLKGFVSGLSAMKNSLSTTLTNTDLSNIRAYNDLLDQGVTAQTAWYRTMQSSSDAAKDLVQSANGGKVALNGMKTASIGVKAGLIGAKVAAIAFNAALTIGISLLIDWAISGITKLVNAKKELAEKVEEVTSKFKEQHEELTKNKSSFESEATRYAKLSKGVDNLGRNVSLTADEYSEYQSIVNSIADQIPSLISGYDSQGNAILNVKGNVDELIAKYEELIHIQNQEILTGTESIEKDFKNTVNKADFGYWESVWEGVPIVNWFTSDDLNTDTVEKLNRLLSGELNIDDAFDINNIDYLDDRQLDEIRKALKDADVDVGFWEGTYDALKRTLESDPAKVKGIIDNYYAQFDEAVEQQKSIAQAKLSEAFDIGSAISGLEYGNISEDLQTVARQVVNSLDYDFFAKLQEDGKSVEDWVTEMLDQLKAIGKEDSSSISAAFDLQTKFNGGEISYGEYVEGLEDTGELINSLNLNQELDSQLKLSLGLNEDGFVEEYRNLVARLSDHTNYDFDSRIMGSTAEEFLNSLSAEELSVAIDVITKLSNNGVHETIQDIRKAIEREMAMQGLSFDLNLEVEAAEIEALNTALAESVSATGLSSESIAALKSRYSDLESEGYDLSAMFEETSNGIHLNKKALGELEQAYAKQKKADIDEDLKELQTQYELVTKDIEKCNDASERASLYVQRDAILQQINDAATLASQYEGLTSAYNDWLAAEEAGQERDMYEKLIEGFENVDDEIKRGWLDDGTIKFLELLTGRNLTTAPIEDLQRAYNDLDKTISKSGYSIRDFFTVNDDGDSTNTGVYNFLETVEDFEGKLGDVIKRKGERIVGFDFKVAGGDKAIADALGISEELVQIMLRAADDAGFVVNLEGAWTQLADLKTEAETARDTLISLKKDGLDKLKDFDVNFDLNADGNDLIEQQAKAIELLNKFKKDGKIDLNMDGAQEALDVAEYLTIRLDDLTEPRYMQVDVSTLEEDLQEPIEKMQEFERLSKEKHLLTLTGDTEKLEEVETKMSEIAQYLDGIEDEETQVKLGIKGLSKEEIEEKLEKGEIELNAELNLDVQMSDDLRDMRLMMMNQLGLVSENEVKLKIGYDIDDSVVEELTEEEKEVVVKYIADHEEVEDWSPEAKNAFVKYLVDGGDPEKFDPDDKDSWVVYDTDTSKPDSYNADDENATVNYDVNDKEVKEYDPPNIFRTVWYSIKETFSNIASGGKKKAAQRTGADPDGSGVDGTANVNGTTGKAFKQGIWGTKNSGSALVGELGRETLVRDGKYYTIGDTGAEFIKYQRGDIIFNHKQTEELFKNGKVTSGGGRGKTFANGSAFVEGTAFRLGSSGSSGSGGAIVKVTGKAVGEAVNVISDEVADKVVQKIGSKGTGGGTDKVSGESVNTNSSTKDESSSTKEEFEESFDWIEIAISRVERAIDQLDKKANNVYKSWSERNSALTSEISKVGDEIELQESAAQRYLKEANSVGLSESYAAKVRSGTINIEDFKGESNEALVEKIKDYQTWYEKYLDCIDAAEELREQESSLYAQRFENIQTQYDGILQGYEHTEAMLNEYISQAEEQGYIVSKKYYQALINNEKSNIAELKREQADLIAERDNAVAEGKITKGSEAWYEQCAAIDEVTQSIEEANTALIEYSNSIRDIDWQIFDLIQERISDITAESEFLIELMSNKDLFDDNGKFTERGVATVGLHALNYNTSMYQADDYGKEVAKLDKQIAKDPYDQELISRRRELLELQRESILSAEDEKNAIKDLVEEGINLELDALQERIDLHNEELDSMKDLYDYQKNVEEQAENIASLRKQIGAYEGFNDEETRAKVQELKVSLEEAEADLQETEYEKFISDQTALLDTLYTEYETILNSRLDNIDFLLEQVIDGINMAAGVEGTITSALGADGAIAVALGNNATTIGETLKTEVGNVGTKLSTAMSNIWLNDGSGKAVLDLYGKDFQTRSTTTNDALNSIKANVAAMVDDVDKDAQKKVEANKTTTSAKKDPTKDTAAKKTNTTTNKTTSSTADGKPKVGDKVKFVSGKYYYDSQGVTPAGSKYQGKEVYITSINTKSWATHPYHISTGSKLGNGDLGWLKLDQISGYAVGKQNFLDDEIAWTQENGREFIVRPSDGAILTPIAKGDSVLTSAASNNIWDMANSPVEFIKDNLGIGSASVPSAQNVNNNITQHFENVTFSMPNVHGYNDLLTEMQRDPKFEKLVLSMTIDRIAGRSSLAKGKSIR